MKKSKGAKVQHNNIHPSFPPQGQETAPPSSMSMPPGKEGRGMTPAVNQDPSTGLSNPGSYSGYSGGDYSSSQDNNY
jgi:hypothetical protein